jgi:hypothetical protein
VRISFDLDDTLICYQPGILQEKSRWGWLSEEPLRQGAVQLIRELQKSGHQVGIYTTSHRNPKQIHFWLWSYGLKTAFILTQHDNDAQSILGKNPRRFQIDCHIDNEAHIADIHVLPEDTDWVDKIRKHLVIP